MRETCPLDDTDRARLGRKAAASRGALRTCAGLALGVPALFMAFVVVTPTQFSLATIGLCAVVCVALDLPLLLKSLDLRRSLRRVQRWERLGTKVCLTGEVTQKGPQFLVTVGGIGIAAWERSRELAVGDVVAVEYLPLDEELGGVVGVLKVDDEPNPYLESAWRSGPPTA